MSKLHVSHVRSKLENDFVDNLDLSDMNPRDITDDLKLSRSLAALAITQYADITPLEACRCVTDGYGDNGLDAVYANAAENSIIVVQSKWVNSGTSSPKVGDVHKFIQGFEDLLSLEFGRFNDKLNKSKTKVNDALNNADIHIDLVLVYSGMQKMSDEASRILSDLIKDQNDVTELVTLHILNLADLHAIVRKEVDGPAPDLDVTLHNWGLFDEPYRAFYGQVDATEIAEWWKTNRSTLFDQNIRKFVTDSTVNNALMTTLKNDPQSFWYFNNGITVLCQGVKKAPQGGSARKSGRFTFEGATVVNGAQTVGSIGSVSESEDNIPLDDARVHVRFISLEDCPPELGRQITRATNTQNRVERRDFVALDPEQERLRTDLKIELDKRYVIKTGDTEPRSPDEGCTLTEATIALDCSQVDVDLAVQTKREIGRLWDDVQKPPYKTLFNSSLRASV